MSVLGSFAFRDMVIEVEELVSTDFNFTVLWLHRIDDGCRETVVVHRDGQFYPSVGVDLGELGLAELGIALERFMDSRSGSTSVGAYDEEKGVD
ncbi:hypothetical protein AB0K52_15225 [Glycomyces sp. NPDC049804]|uniref:hypothetical protein n=1 Tax=Glycomyces sp. NPDC049804 TaxID=3154363 RepID=UPI0034267D96